MISLIEADAEQENGGGEEIVNLLKHVRPGNGFEFKGDMFDKVDLIRQFFFLPFCIFLVLKLMFAEPNTFFFYLRNIIVWTGGGEWREWTSPLHIPQKVAACSFWRLRKSDGEVGEPFILRLTSKMF